MLMTPIDVMREEPLKALGTTIGVLLIIVLLYAVGAVAQGQVKRAAARDTQMVAQQVEQLRCLRSGSGARCSEAQPVSQPAAVPVRIGGPMYVSYR